MSRSLISGRIENVTLGRYQYSAQFTDTAGTV